MMKKDITPTITCNKLQEASEPNQVRLSLTQPPPINDKSSEDRTNSSDMEHINCAFDIAYYSLTAAKKTTDFCAVIKAIQSSIGLRRQVLGHDKKGKPAEGGKRIVDLLT